MQVQARVGVQARGPGRALQCSTAGTKNSTHGYQLYIGLYWGSRGMVMFVGYYSAVVPHKCPGVLKIVPGWIIVPDFRRWRAGYGWSCGTAQGTQPCYLKRRHGGLLAGPSSTRSASHMANPGRRLGTIFSTVVPARVSALLSMLAV